ncbi:NF-kappa-B-repressing factor-like [Sabethes cyaneus]|uniref:NF-kappa-B-repressing factor-like n=1 Tax=Sabethes cyaneus TaxID=53552 RepID=UPI00237EDD58|nr:NF-kappa-B-repressing factor-like [Sabethes cyaneus]
MSKRKRETCHDGQETKTAKNVAIKSTHYDANTNWNIDDYRTPYEPDEHWELRRLFMERHQLQIPEDELVCMAQVFVNVELLHCRYPLETMQRIKELSEGIANEYRASRRNKLQRTFVSASNAAALKVQRKGASEQETYRGSDLRTEYSRKFKPVANIQTLEDAYNNIVLLNNDYEQTKMEFNKLGDSKLTMRITKNSDGTISVAVMIGELTLVSAVNNGEKMAVKTAKQVFLKTMQSHCYHIIRQQNPVELQETLGSKMERKVVEGMVDHSGRPTSTELKEKKIDESNLGFKLLQKLGWSGGSLGAKNEGIVDPIKCQIKIGRKGLGVNSTEQSDTMKTGKINPRDNSYSIDVNFYRRTMQNFRKSGIEYDLVFSSEFTKEERALLHSMAQTMQLKTRSYGKDENGTRQLVLLGRKLPPHELLDRILIEKDTIFCQLYTVKPPTGNNESD